LKVSPEADKLISQMAHFMSMTKKDVVEAAIKEYAEHHREERRRGMIEAMQILDGSLKSSVALLTGLSPEHLDELGGVGDWDDVSGSA
jgi:hypothetical protein